MTSIIFTGISDLQASLEQYNRSFSPNSRQRKVLFGRLGRKGRDRVRKNITEQRGFPPLSKWTRARTGRRKGLVTERQNITFIVKPLSVEIGYTPKSTEWNLTKHHKGFTVKGSSNKITIPLKRPRAIEWSKPTITLRGTGPSIVPARPVWGDINQIMRYVGPTTRDWARKIINKKGRT